MAYREMRKMPVAAGFGRIGKASPDTKWDRIWPRISTPSSRFSAGPGLLGRHGGRAGAKRDYRIRVAVRRPELAGHLQPLGRVGQIHAVQANLRYPASVEAAMRDSHVAINLCGILTESGAQTFDAVQARGAGTVAKAASAADARMVHVSAIGADSESPSRYGRAKAAGEKAVLETVASATILRPSLVFG